MNVRYNECNAARGKAVDQAQTNRAQYDKISEALAEMTRKTGSWYSADQVEVIKQQAQAGFEVRASTARAHYDAANQVHVADMVRAKE